MVAAASSGSQGGFFDAADDEVLLFQLADFGGDNT
jgi:hypothetical protein